MNAWSRSSCRSPTAATGSATTRSSPPRWCSWRRATRPPSTRWQWDEGVADTPRPVRRLVTGEVDAATAVEELLRWDSPLQMFARWVLEPGVEISGRQLAVGDQVAMLFGSAQRDPRRFHHPDRFDAGAWRPDPHRLRRRHPLLRRRAPGALRAGRRPGRPRDQLPQRGTGRRTRLPPHLRNPRPHRTTPDDPLIVVSGQ